jgi:hypothetical protein
MSEPPRRGGPGGVRLAETLLGVDDEADVRALARDALVSLGYVVLVGAVSRARPNSKHTRLGS